MHVTWPDELYEQAWPVALGRLELLTDEARWIHRRPRGAVGRLVVRAVRRGRAEPQSRDRRAGSEADHARGGEVAAGNATGGLTPRATV